MNNASVVAQTIVQLAQLAVIAYGIQSTRLFLIHWLDKREGPLFTRKQAIEAAIDEVRKNPDTESA